MNIFPISPLFVPANRLELVEKALVSGADALIFDLEDSVPQEEKEQSRKDLKNFLNNNKLSCPSLVRINSLNSESGKQDLLLFHDLPKGVLAIVLSKVESIENMSSVPKSSKIILLIETPLAVKNLDMLSSDPRVRGLFLGAADLSSSLGADMSWNSMLYVRSRIVLEAAINGLFCIDSPFMQIDSPRELEAECKMSKSLGFTSKAAIHPSQIKKIRHNFLPSEEEIKEAMKILKAYADSKGGAIAVDGKMVDEPVVELMKKKLVLAGLDPDN